MRYEECCAPRQEHSAALRHPYAGRPAFGGAIGLNRASRRSKWVRFKLIEREQKTFLQWRVHCGSITEVTWLLYSVKY